MPDEQPFAAPPPIQPPPTISPPPASAPLPEPERKARLWNMLCHLSVLSGCIIPFGNFLGPLLIWQIKKHEVPSVEYHGKVALNFQLTVLIGILISGALALVGTFFCLGHILIALPFLVGLAGLIFPIVNGIKANDGQPINYPLTIEFFR